MSTSGDTGLGQASSEERDAAGRGEGCVVETNAWKDGVGTIERQPIEMYDKEEARRMQIASMVMGGVFVLIALGLIAVTWASLVEKPTAGIVQYVEVVSIPLFGLATFVAGYLFRARLVRKFVAVSASNAG